MVGINEELKSGRFFGTLTYKLVVLCYLLVNTRIEIVAIFSSFCLSTFELRTIDYLVSHTHKRITTFTVCDLFVQKLLGTNKIKNSRGICAPHGPRGPGDGPGRCLGLLGAHPSRSEP